MNNKKYNLEYFKELDELVRDDLFKKEEYKKYRFIPLTVDSVFKGVMRRNADIFKDFLIKVMEIDINEEDNMLYFLDKELIKGNIKEKGRVLDFNVTIGHNLLINVEMNTEEYSAIMTRNDLYLEKLDVMQFEVGEDYRFFKDKKIYQLNLNAHDSEDKNILKRKIVEYDEYNKEVTDSRKRKFIFNLVSCKNMFYNNRRMLSDEEVFMAGLVSKNYTELYTIMSSILEDKRLNKFMESVINMSKEWESVHEWEKEKMDAMVRENIRELDRKRVEEEVMKKFEEKVKESEEKVKESEEKVKESEEKVKESEEKIKETEEKVRQMERETIINMLKNNADYEFISKVTNKSIKEIKEIEKSMNE